MFVSFLLKCSRDGNGISTVKGVGGVGKDHAREGILFYDVDYRLHSHYSCTSFEMVQETLQPPIP